MTTLTVRWTTFPAVSSLLDVLDGPDPAGHEGTLTDEHAASSYGLPVVVDATGAALGTAELASEIVADMSTLTADGRALLERALVAGYRALVVTPEAFARAFHSASKEGSTR